MTDEIYQDQFQMLCLEFMEIAAHNELHSIA